MQHLLGQGWTCASGWVTLGPAAGKVGDLAPGTAHQADQPRSAPGPGLLGFGLSGEPGQELHVHTGREVCCRTGRVPGSTKGNRGVDSNEHFNKKDRREQGGVQSTEC